MKKYLFILLLTFSGGVFGQMVHVPDPALRLYLQNTYPFVMNGDSLDTSLSPQINNGIDIFDLGVSDADVLDYFPNLSFIDARKNNLTSFPDLSRFVSADRIHLDSNRLSNIIIANTSDTLKALTLSYNAFTSLPDLSNLPKLEILRGKNNQIVDFEPFNNNDSLIVVELQYNKLSFEEMIDAQGHPNFGQFDFFPQDSIGPGGTYFLAPGDSVFYQLNQDTGVATNDYIWYLNGDFYKFTQTGSIYFDTTGVFTVDIANSSVSMFDSLKGLPIHVLETTCIDLSGLIVQQTPISCEKGGTLFIDESSISGGALPYHYLLRDTLSEMTFLSSAPNFTNIKEGHYELSIQDANNCTSTYNSIFTFSFPLDCPNNIITKDYPYFSVDTPGVAKIYDRSGKLIKKFDTPGVWNGTDLNGQLVSMGLYFIEVGDVVYKVTMIR